MVTHDGMSEVLSLATYDTQRAALYLDGPALPEQRNCSEHTAEVVDAEVRRLLADLLRPAAMEPRSDESALLVAT